MTTQYDDNRGDFDDRDEWSDDDEWDDDDYDEFIEREFPDASGTSGGSGTSLPAIWKWTAWTLLAVIFVFWAWLG